MNAAPGNAGGSATRSRMRRTSAAGAKPNTD